MAAIKYTSIINSFVSPEGSFGAITNYIYYSVLVVYSDGTKEIIEGKGKEIAPLLYFLRTPVDELQEIKQLITSIPWEIRSINDNMTNVIDILDEICEKANNVESEEPILDEERDESEDNINPESINDTPFMCYCRNCKSFFWATSKNKKDECPKCGGFVVETTIMQDSWNALSKEEKIQTLFDNGILMREEYNEKMKQIRGY